MRFVSLLVLVASTGCTGLSLGVNTPGAPADVGRGALAVDDRTDTVFVVSGHRQRGVDERRLHAVAVDAEPRLVATMRERKDQRLLFPDAGVLLMNEGLDGEELTLFDRQTLVQKRTVTVSARYWGTRQSPSGRWIAAVDNDDDRFQVHIIDPETLAIRPVPHGGKTLEAAWSSDDDILMAASFDDAGVRIMSWSMLDVSSRDFATDASGAWSEPVLDIRIADKAFDMAGSFTWLTVSSDGRWLVVPVHDDKQHELIVVDVRDGTHRIVENAKGPAGFTGDDSTLVTYVRDADDIEQIVLVDLTTFARRDVAVPRLPRFNFHVLESSVVVAPVVHPHRDQSPHRPLFVFDVGAPGSGVVVEPARVHLDEFVERPLNHDLWLVSHGRLNRVDVAHQAVEELDLGFSMRHINRLPTRDWLVFDRHGSPKSPQGAIDPQLGLMFWDPDSRKVVRQVAISD